ncbi:MAG: hypothetical protein HYY84_07935 [Deltaproteobacteria bacterium]|nr:hypothetical protein [Deltaproteobacteria bacterium]
MMRVVLATTLLAQACAVAPDTAVWRWGADPIDDTGRARLDERGPIFVQTGRVTRDRAGTIRCVSFAERVGVRGLRATPVVQLAGALARGYRDDELGAIVAAARRCADHAGRAFQKVGARAVGLQIDFDFPTRRLAHLGRVAAVLGGFRPLSATLLPTWLVSPAAHRELRAVVQSFDLVVPMVFDEPSLANLDVMLRRTDALGVAYRIGLPAFAEIRRLDAKGRWSSFRTIADDMLSDAATDWRVAKGSTKRLTRPGEELHAVRAEQLRTWIAHVHAHASRLNRGTIVFRAPRRDEAGLFASANAATRITFSCVARDGAVDVTMATPRGAPAFDVAVEIRVVEAGGLIAPPPPPWSVAHFCGGLPCGPRRADTLVLRRPVLANRETVQLAFRREPRSVACRLLNR